MAAIIAMEIQRRNVAVSLSLSPALYKRDKDARTR
jgi:hypothetical protein